MGAAPNMSHSSVHTGRQHSLQHTWMCIPGVCAENVEQLLSAAFIVAQLSLAACHLDPAGWIV